MMRPIAAGMAGCVPAALPPRQRRLLSSRPPSQQPSRLPQALHPNAQPEPLHPKAESPSSAPYCAVSTSLVMISLSCVCRSVMKSQSRVVTMPSSLPPTLPVSAAGGVGECSVERRLARCIAGAPNGNGSRLHLKRAGRQAKAQQRHASPTQPRRAPGAAPVTQTEVKPLRSRRLCSSATVEEGSMQMGCTTKPGVWFLAVLTCGEQVGVMNSLIIEGATPRARGCGSWRS